MKEIIKQLERIVKKHENPLKKSISCPCGGKYQSVSKNRHLKTDKHKRWLKKQEK